MVMFRFYLVVMSETRSNHSLLSTLEFTLLFLLGIKLLFVVLMVK